MSRSASVTILAIMRDLISGPAAKADKALGGIVATINKMNGLVGPLQGRVAGLVGAFAGLNAIRKGIDVASAAATAEQKLNAVLKGNNALIEERRRKAEELSKVTIFSRDQFLQAEATLRGAGVGADKIDVALRGTAEAAAFLGRDLNRVAVQMGQVMSGVVDEFGQSIPQLKQLSRAQLEAGQGFDLIAKTFENTNKKILSTDFGKAKKQSADLELVYKRLGDVFIRLQVVVMPKVIDAFDKFVKRLEAPEGKQFIQTLSQIGIFLVENAEKMVAFLLVMKGLDLAGRGIDTIRGALGLLIGRLVQTTNAAGKTVTTLKLSPLLIAGFVAAAGVGLGTLIANLAKADTGVRSLNDGWKLVTDTVARFKDGSLTFTDIVERITSELKILGIRFKLYFYDIPNRYIQQLKDQFSPTEGGGLVDQAQLASGDLINSISKAVGGGNVYDLRPYKERIAAAERRGLYTPLADVIAEETAKADDEIRKLNEKVEKAAQARGDALIDAASKATADRLKARAEETKKAFVDAAKTRDELLAQLETVQRQKGKVKAEEVRKEEADRLQNDFKNRLVGLTDYLAQRAKLENDAVQEQLKATSDALAKARAERLANDDRMLKMQPSDVTTADVGKSNALLQTEIDLTKRLTEIRFEAEKQAQNQRERTIEASKSNEDAAKAALEVEMKRADLLKDTGRIDEAGRVRLINGAYAEYVAAVNESIAALEKLKAAEADPRRREAIENIITGIDTSRMEVESNIRDSVKNLNTLVAQGLKEPFEEFFSSVIKGTASIKEAFANMLQTIAGKLADFAAQQLTNKLLGALFGQADSNGNRPDGGGLLGGLLGGLGSLLGFGRAEGGPVEGRRTVANVDTVLTPTAPGEWVHRRAAVDFYGPQVMAAINRMVVPKSVLQGFAAPIPARTTGLAQGGPAPSSGKGTGAVVVPAIPANESTMQSLLTGGKAALIQFMARHRSEVSAALGR